MTDAAALARASYDAYVREDRAAIEAWIAEDFHFTSPLDNRIDRATYFERCWPNSEKFADHPRHADRRRRGLLRVVAAARGARGRLCKFYESLIHQLVPLEVL
jgi:ketosteroid isomerase-like protein